MSSVVIAGDSSGSVTLQAPSVAGSTVLTLPATSGTIAIGGTTPSFSTLSVSGNTSLTTAGGVVLIGGAPASILSAQVTNYGRYWSGSGNSSGNAEYLLSNYASPTCAATISVRQDVGGANNDLKFLWLDSSGSYQGVAMQIQQANGALKLSSGQSILNSSGNIMAAQTGGVIQTTQNFVASTVSGSNVGVATFWFQHSFVPKSASSSFLITCVFNGIDNGGSGRLQVGLYIDTVSGGTTGVLQGQAQLASSTTGTNGCYTLAINRYYQTALTPGTTYYLKAIVYKNDTSTSWVCGEYGNNSSITVQEIAA